MSVTALPSTPLARRLMSKRLRRRQAADRLAVSSRLVSEAAHPSRSSAVPLERRQQVARHMEAAQRHLRAAEILVREAL
jgi:hypothetical protein